ncbi:hypothetical protein RvY_03823 [Ramazzottius varieornatus]|uniref:Uncharacterized protein n=1 Tax=Ramazzottius varieornatus TaxID=947166 RepID=A0A1D1UZJ8_RAMVA|nr:hypothetical protein RvY_03823 [Ramazzottius varieornatus]
MKDLATLIVAEETMPLLCDSYEELPNAEDVLDLTSPRILLSSTRHLQPWTEVSKSKDFLSNILPRLK